LEATPTLETLAERSRIASYPTERGRPSERLNRSFPGLTLTQGIGHEPSRMRLELLGRSTFPLPPRPDKGEY
jgi:hypothetical protein